MTKKIGRRRRGGQPCNHNALKHGFYSSNRVIVDGDKLPARAVLSELDHDVALTRVTLRRLFAKDPDNVDLITRTLRLHDRLLRTRQNFIDRERRARRRQRRSPSHPSLTTSTAKTINAGLPASPSPKVSTPDNEGIGGGIEGGFRQPLTGAGSLSLQVEREPESEVSPRGTNASNRPSLASIR